MKLFFQLLRNELWREGEVPERLSPEEFEEVYTTAREQSVGGLVCNAIIRNGVQTGDDNAMRTMAVKVNHERRARNMSGALHTLVRCLTACHVRHFVFKGQTIAALYPDASMRTLGDVDFYCAPSEYERAKQVVQETMGVQIHLSDIDKHDDFEYDGFRFELHRRLETFGSSRHQRYFDMLVGKVMDGRLPEVDVEGMRISVLPPTVNVLLCFKHLFNHFLIEGVGLRQFCDMAILLHRYHDEIDVDELSRHLLGIGYLKAFKAVGALAVRYLHLPEKEFPFGLTAKDYRWADKMILEVLKRGNFGKYHRSVSRQGIAKSLETSKIAFGHVRRFFPLAPWDILCLIPRRIGITAKGYLT